MKAFRIDDQNFVVLLSEGEDIRAQLSRFAVQENITGAEITGVGAVTELCLGWYDCKNNLYRKKEFTADYELVSSQGNISILNGEVFIHLHVAIGDENFQMHGGHLFSGKISVVGEFLISKLNCKLERAYTGQLALLENCVLEKT